MPRGHEGPHCAAVKVAVVPSADLRRTHPEWVPEPDDSPSREDRRPGRVIEPTMERVGRVVTDHHIPGTGVVSVEVERVEHRTPVPFETGMGGRAMRVMTLESRPPDR
jgi:hypothetical protein